MVFFLKNSCFNGRKHGGLMGSVLEQSGFWGHGVPEEDTLFGLSPLRS